MTRPDVFEIVYDNPAGVYNAGQVLKGTVNLNLSEELELRSIKITLTGEASTHWVEVKQVGQATVVIPYHGSESYFEEDVFLEKHSEDGKTLSAGTRSYPFQFKLPDHLPSSFEHSNGRVRYYAECCIDRPWAFDYTSKKAFSVISILDLNTIGVVTGEFENEGYKTLCCLCCKSQPIEGIIRIKRKAFVPGEKVTFDAEISNRSSRTVSETEVVLKQVITFYSTGIKRDHIQKERVIRKLEHDSIPGKGSDNWINEGFVIPPLPPSELKGCSIIDISYTLELIVDPRGTFIDLIIPLDIVIGNVPLKETFDSFKQLASQANHSAFPSMPADQSGMAPLDVESQREAPAPITPILPDAPPAVYHESVFGKSPLKDEDEKDKGEAMGELEFAPVYLTYHYDNTAFDPAVEN